MKVKIVTKIGCPRCMLLKDKLEILNVEYEEAGEADLDEVVNPEDVEGMQYPIAIFEGRAYAYAEAIKVLKESIALVRDAEENKDATRS